MVVIRSALFIYRCGGIIYAMLEQLTRREQLIWLACFIDTDGSISLTYTRFPYYYPTIMFGQKTDALLTEIMMHFDRVIWQDKEHRKSGTMEIKMFGTHTRDLLEQLIPFLVLKRRQAQICIDYANYLKLRDRRPRGDTGLDEEQKEMIIEIRKLNARKSGKWNKPRLE